MLFTSKGNEGLEIKYEDTDTDYEKRMVEQGVAFILNTLKRIREVESLVVSHNTR